MSHEPTRKTFLKFLGLAIGAGLVGRFFRRASSSRSSVPPPAAPRISADPRAVARRADTI
ncbi:MAG TPA: hypothetical protein VFB27_11185 [Opitutaceae bacterium]|nr:hypothetical protein [Opitutaceae bacterium]